MVLAAYIGFCFVLLAHLLISYLVSNIVLVTAPISYVIFSVFTLNYHLLL